jgi:hypothetical protein
MACASSPSVDSWAQQLRWVWSVRVPHLSPSGVNGPQSLCTTTGSLHSSVIGTS